MKRHIPMFMILFLVMQVTGRLIAQQPEKVYSLVKEVHPFEWYAEQAKAWKAVLDNDPHNGQGWIYYYTANRMARLTDLSRWEAARGDYFRELSVIVEMAQRAVPGTYEALYIKLYNASTGYPGYEKDLLKASELAGGRAEILDEMVLYYEVQRNAEKRREYSRQWFRSNDIPSGILNYNYNVLQTLEADAVIITAGDNDTFPLWVLQDELGLKPGVVVLNLPLLAREDYRKKVFGELQIPDIRFRAGDYPGQDTLFALRKLILTQVVAKAKRPVYLALTLDTRYYLGTEMEDDLYLAGLAMRYQEKEFDNLGVIRRHFEHDYLLDYLRVSFHHDPSAAVAAQMNTGYLPSLVKLCSHYSTSGEEDKLALVKQLMAAIITAAGGDKELMEFNFFYRRLGRDEAKAQDFLHDLFLKLLNDPEKYTPGKAFRPWFYSVAMNMCRNEYRRLKVREEYQLGLAPDQPVTATLPDAIDRALFGQELEERLRRLDEVHREVFLLRYREEFSIAEIAEVMGCPEGTVKSRLYYTLRTLSAQLNVFNPLIN